ncbi:MAG: hypothetical protein ABI605_03440 [Rhizobacter sp.]
MKTAVDKVKKGKGRIVNERFAYMCGHYLYDPDFCNVASGWEKGDNPGSNPNGPSFAPLIQFTVTSQPQAPLT